MMEKKWISRIVILGIVVFLISKMLSRDYVEVKVTNDYPHPVGIVIEDANQNIIDTLNIIDSTFQKKIHVKNLQNISLILYDKEEIISKNRSYLIPNKGLDIIITKRGWLQCTFGKNEALFEKFLSVKYRTKEHYLRFKLPWGEFKDYVEILHKKNIQALDSLFLDTNSLDKEYYSLQKENLYYNLLNDKVNYLISHELSTKAKGDSINYYQSLEDISKLIWPVDSKKYNNESYKKLLKSLIYRSTYDMLLSQGVPQSKYSTYFIGAEATLAYIDELDRLGSKNRKEEFLHRFLIDDKRLKFIENEHLSLITEIYYKNVSNPEFIKEFDEAITRLKLLGKGIRAPSFEIKDIQEELRSIEDFKGKYVVLYFWATWCGPCKGEAPYWEEFIKKFADQEVVFLNVSTDENKDAWKEMVVNQSKGGIHLFAGDDRLEIKQNYQVSGIPHYVLIDKEGLIVQNHFYRPSYPPFEEKLGLLLQ